MPTKITISNDAEKQNEFNTLVDLVLNGNGILTIDGSHLGGPISIDCRSRGWKMYFEVGYNGEQRVERCEPKKISVGVLKTNPTKLQTDNEYLYDKQAVKKRIDELKKIIHDNNYSDDRKDRLNELIAAETMLSLAEFFK